MLGAKAQHIDAYEGKQPRHAEPTGQNEKQNQGRQSDVDLCKELKGDCEKLETELGRRNELGMEAVDPVTEDRSDREAKQDPQCRPFAESPSGRIVARHSLLSYQDCTITV